jgi:DNA-binding MarR family transcriptional regulator
MAAVERSRRLSNRLSRLLQARLGITIYQVGVLAAVEEGARHLGDVAGATGQQASVASRLVDRLVKDGLLERSADRADRRAVVLDLTVAGRRALGDARQVFGRTMQRALDRVPPDQARQLMPALTSFLEAAEVELDETQD